MDLYGRPTARIERANPPLGLPSDLTDIDAAIARISASCGTFDHHALEASRRLKKVTAPTETTHLYLGDLLRYNVLADGTNFPQRPTKQQLRTITQSYINALEIKCQDSVRDGKYRVQQGFVLHRAQDFAETFRPLFLQYMMNAELSALDQSVGGTEAIRLNQLKGISHTQGVAAALLACRTYTSDPHNVHDKCVRQDIKRKLNHLTSKCIADGFDVPGLDTAHQHLALYITQQGNVNYEPARKLIDSTHAKKEVERRQKLAAAKVRALAMLDKICSQEDGLSETYQCEPRDVLRLVYARVNEAGNRTMTGHIKESLFRTLAEMHGGRAGDCVHARADARVARLVECLSGIDCDEVLSQGACNVEQYRNHTLDQCAGIWMQEARHRAARAQRMQQRGGAGGDQDIEFVKTVKRRWLFEVLDEAQRKLPGVTVAGVERVLDSVL